MYNLSPCAQRKRDEVLLPHVESFGNALLFGGAALSYLYAVSALRHRFPAGENMTIYFNTYYILLEDDGDRMYVFVDCRRSRERKDGR